MAVCSRCGNKIGIFEPSMNGLCSACIAEIDKEKRKSAEKIIVSTGSINKSYDIVGLVYFQVSNSGYFSSQLDTLCERYIQEITQWLDAGLISSPKHSEAAFYIAVEELKIKSLSLGADAIIELRSEIVFDSGQKDIFFMQVYGTAVKFLATENDLNSKHETAKKKAPPLKEGDYIQHSDWGRGKIINIDYVNRFCSVLFDGNDEPVKITSEHLKSGKVKRLKI